MAQPTKQTHLFAVHGTDSLRLDHYAAPVEGLRPCIMFVFGGGFAHGTRDAEKYAPYFAMLLRSGYDVVAIDYRLGMSATAESSDNSSIFALRRMIGMMKRSVDIAVEDLFAATAFVLEHAAEWRIDPSRIVASGSSAGAITVLQAELCICNGDAKAAVLPAGFNYGGVISFAGAIFSTCGRPEWSTAPCPVMLFHGNSDRNVPYRKAAVLGIGYYGSELIAEDLERLDAPYWFYSAKYRDHAMAEEPMCDNHGQILEFLNRCVRAGERLQIVESVEEQSLGVQPTDFSIFEYLGANYD